MFASRRSPLLFWRRRPTHYSIGATAGVAVLTAAATAAAVYFFDSESGRRRRALLRDQVVSAGRRGRKLAGKIGRGVRQRASQLEIPRAVN